jgi:hypothetical protein
VRSALLLVCVGAALASPAAALAADPTAGAYGGPYTAADGETVNVYTSSLYPKDDTVNQRWADFLASLVHGPELADVTLLLAPLGQVGQSCGLGAYGCYKADSATIIASLDRPAPDGPSPEGVVAHEYGHHVAAHRTNAPWNARTWGTKRWATAMHVCPRVRAGKLHPGDERVYYLFNPGEAFAESYRLLNETALGLPVTAWSIVDTSLQPGQAALDALRQDVLAPSSPAPALSFTGTFSRGGPEKPRIFLVKTPLDGTITASVSGSRGASFRVSIQGKPTTSEIVCGVRKTAVSVARVSGYGSFRLTVTPP